LLNHAVEIRAILPDLYLTELENLVRLRLQTRDRLAGRMQSAFQVNQDAQRLFAPWLQTRLFRRYRSAP
jgi:hypothetical protein